MSLKIKSLINEEVQKVIKELYDTKADLEWKDSFLGVEAEFAGPNSVKYIIEISFMGDNAANIMYQTRKAFPNSDPKVLSRLRNCVHNDIIRVTFKNETAEEEDPRAKRKIYGVSGDQGLSAAQIFGIVINGISDFVKKNNTQGVFFSAVERSRQRLYHQIASTLASKHGFEFGSYKDTFGETVHVLMNPELLNHAGEVKT